MSCSQLQRLGHNNFDVLRSARSKGERCRHKNNNGLSEPDYTSSKRISFKEYRTNYSSIVDIFYE